MDHLTIEQLIAGWLMPSFLGAVVAFVLGIIWYHPRILGEKWAEARGQGQEELRRNATPFVVSLPLWFVTSMFFTFILRYMNIGGPSEVFLMACLLWVAFAMPPIVMASLYTGHPFGAAAIDASYQLAGYYALASVHIALGWL